MTRLTLADVERRLRERLGETACDVWARWLPGFQKDVAEFHVLMDDRCEIQRVDAEIAEMPGVYRTVEIVEPGVGEWVRGLLTLGAKRPDWPEGCWRRLGKPSRFWATPESRRWREDLAAR